MAVIAKLGNPAWQFPFVEPFNLQRFDLLDRWIVVQYAADTSKLTAIQVGLKPRKPKKSVLPGILQPDVQAITAQFLHEWPDVAADPAFTGVDFSEFGSAAPTGDCPHELDALATHGVELYFRKSEATEQLYGVLTSARYIRRGLYWSSGFDGKLPHDIRFEDKPEALIDRVGRYPEAGKADFLTGYYVWRMQEYVLQVGFSVMEQRVNRIYICENTYCVPDLFQTSILRLPVGETSIASGA